MEVYIVGPDEVGVTHLISGAGERIHQREVPAALVHQHHVPQVAPVVQDGGVRLGVLGHLLDDLLPPVILALVVLGAGFSYTQTAGARVLR